MLTGRTSIARRSPWLAIPALVFCASSAHGGFESDPGNKSGGKIVTHLRFRGARPGRDSQQPVRTDSAPAVSVPTVKRTYGQPAIVRRPLPAELELLAGGTPALRDAVGLHRRAQAVRDEGGFPREAYAWTPGAVLEHLAATSAATLSQLASALDGRAGGRVVGDAAFEAAKGLALWERGHAAEVSDRLMELTYGTDVPRMRAFQAAGELGRYLQAQRRAQAEIWGWHTRDSFGAKMLAGQGDPLADQILATRFVAQTFSEALPDAIRALGAPALSAEQLATVRHVLRLATESGDPLGIDPRDQWQAEKALQRLGPRGDKPASTLFSGAVQALHGKRFLY